MSTIPLDGTSCGKGIARSILPSLPRCGKATGANRLVTTSEQYGCVGVVEGGEQVRGGVPDVVVGAFLGGVEGDRQQGLRAVQRLDLRLVVQAEHYGSDVALPGQRVHPRGRRCRWLLQHALSALANRAAGHP